MALVLHDGKILKSGDSPGWYDQNGVYHPSALQELEKEHRKEIEERRKHF